MTFVSYAQNFEDAMLWRALRHIEHGCYVDVGAQHPLIDSVSKAFYERGWRGVHIEPVRAYADLLRADRPGDTVLEVALGEKSGTVPLHVFPSTGLSTAVTEHAVRHETHGGFAAELVDVPVLTLQSALGMLAGKDVHWLKIDVEGFEEQVLKGWDSNVLRPWVLVVEATIPGSSATDFDRWDPLVTRAGYGFVYFDGLNRFYVANERPELRAAFAVPPNVFDDLQVSGSGSWPLCGLAVRDQRQEGALANAALQAELAAAVALRDQTTTELAAVRHELSQANQALLADGARLAEARLALEAQAVHAAATRRELVAQLLLRQEERDCLATQLADTQAARLAQEGEAATRLAELAREAAQSARDADHARAELVAAHQRTHEWWVVADRVSHEVQALLASNSWKLTAPLRRAHDVGRVLASLPARVWRGGMRRARAVLKRILAGGLRVALQHRVMGAPARALLRQFPGLKRVLRDFAGRAGLIQAVAGVGVAPDTPPPVHPALAPRAARLLAQLEHAIDARKS